MTQDQLDDIIEDIMTSTWDSGRTKILNFARLMCKRQKEICSYHTEGTIDSYLIYDCITEYDEQVLNAPYPDELQGNN